LYPNLSVKDNLHFRAEVFGLQSPTQAIAAVLDRLGLRPFADLPAAQLSGGWGRLLQLAAALVHDPQIVLLDEPTAGLDAVARQAVWRQITRLASEETALVLSTHDLLDAGRCSRIVFLSQGTERASGRPTDLVCATNGTVLAVLGPRVLGLVELLQAIPGVITTYLSGECLRVVVARGSESRVMSTPELRDFAIEPVPPTLEDAVLALSETEPRGSG
jgi:ABC-2 type transport system ATP-binding protein